jgi:lipopolysaccharide export LptBFGC system permease protein LptF
MLYELASNNPLLLISHARIPKLRTAYIQMDPAHHGAHNLFIALFNTTTNQINCLLSQEISIEHEKITAEHLSLITSSPQNNALIIENQNHIEGLAANVASFLTSAKGWKIANDHLTLRLLRVRKKEYQEARSHISSKEEYKQYTKKIRKCDLELMRRSSLALTPLTFTLMGVALGIHISRYQARKRVILVAILALSTLIAFFAAKELSHFFYLATTLFFLPHSILMFISCRVLYRITRGME